MTPVFDFAEKSGVVYSVSCTGCPIWRIRANPEHVPKLAGGSEVRAAINLVQNFHAIRARGGIGYAILGQSQPIALMVLSSQQATAALKNKSTSIKDNQIIKDRTPPPTAKVAKSSRWPTAPSSVQDLEACVAGVVVLHPARRLAAGA
jgi:hypothetical protein